MAPRLTLQLEEETTDRKQSEQRAAGMLSSIQAPFVSSSAKGSTRPELSGKTWQNARAELQKRGWEGSGGGESRTF